MLQYNSLHQIITAVMSSTPCELIHDNGTGPVLCDWLAQILHALLRKYKRNVDIY